MTSALSLDLAPTGDTGPSTWLHDACQALAAKGYTTIAIGVMLGVGQQRVSEILGRAQRGNLANRGVVSVMADDRESEGKQPFGATCLYCGFRCATTAGHPVGKLSGKPVCTLPPEMRAGEL